MSFNIRHGRALDGRNRWSRRRELLFRTLRDADADVIGLQEALDFQLAEILERLPGYLAIGKGRAAKRVGEHTPVLVRRDRFTVTTYGDFWLSETPDEPGSLGWDAALPRMATWATLEDADGSPFVVANTHFDHKGRTARHNGVHLVVDRVRAQELPAVVMGDLNADEGTGVLGRFRDAGFRDTFRVVRPDEPGSTYHGFGRYADGLKIDYILVDAGWDVIDAAIPHVEDHGRHPSDHHPITATVRVG